MSGQKIKVLHLIKSLGRGGAEMLLPETLSLHDKSQFEFHYIYFLPWKNQMVEPLLAQGSKVTCFPASNNLTILLKAREVAAYIRTHGIRVVHCHMPWAGILGRVIFRFYRIPVLYTEHNKQERYHWITRRVNAMTFNWQTAAFAVSEDVSNSIQRNIRPRIPVTVIINGVNNDRFRRDVTAGAAIRASNGIPLSAVVVGTVAVFRSQKRLKDWLEIFKTALASRPELFGIVIGDGPLAEEIAHHRKVLALESHLLMPGLKTDIAPWLSAMDIFMMTSRFEGLPVALLEAMSAECAVLATDAGGIKEVIRQDVDGIQVDVENPLSLAAHLVQLVEDPQRRKRLAAAARQRVITAFDLKTMTRSLEQQYSAYS